MYKQQTMEEYEGVEAKLHELLTSALEECSALRSSRLTAGEGPPVSNGLEAG
jgi:hypothetical protein